MAKQAVGALKSKIEHYRERAAQAEENARLAEDPDARSAYRRAATCWAHMAEQAERMDNSPD